MASTDVFYKFMDDTIKTFIPEGDFSVSVVTEAITEYLMKNESEFIAEFQAELLSKWLHEYLSSTLRGRRQELYRATRSSNIKETLEKITSGDKEAVDAFRVTYVVNDENTWRHLADMTGEDHLYVAKSYEISGKKSLLLSSFHKAIAKKLGNKKTSEVISEEEYLKLFSSMVKE